MKHKTASSEDVSFSSAKIHKTHETPKILLLTTIIFILLIILSLYNPLLRPFQFTFSSKRPSLTSSSPSSTSSTPIDTEEDDGLTSKGATCDIFAGQWVPNLKAPYYTNKTCWAIHEHQNCIKYGRPDTEYMKWRWKPDGCELPLFDPAEFLELVRDKSIAIVGDSLARNQVQSMICLLSNVEYPIDISPTNDYRFKRWKYATYNFTLANFFVPHLVKSKEVDSNGSTSAGLFGLYLDEYDENWTTQIEGFDHLIISAGHWFFGPLIFYEKNRIVGCHSCLLPNVTDLTMFYGYRKAFRTAFNAINSLKNYKGITYLRTFSPPHFENGTWNQGGNCVRTRPFRSNETSLVGAHLELYMIQVEEFRKAKEEGKRRGLKYRLLDTTQAMLLRPDGHPSKYGHWPHENVTMYNDCVHWCLPGPIDAWSDFLLQMLKMEGRR